MSEIALWSTLVSVSGDLEMWEGKRREGGNI